MIKWSWIVVLFLISCNSKIKIQEIPLTFVEKCLLKDSVDIDLPVFKHGLPFFEDDSTTYLNIYLINDSTVQVNEDRFELKKNNERKFFVAKDITDNRKFSNYFGDTDTILNHINENLFDSNFRINLFFDSSIHYGLIDNLYASIFKLTNTNRFINIIDKNNQYIQITQSVYKENRIPAMRLRSLFEILINKNNQFLIEGRWASDMPDISLLIKDWYTNPNAEPDLPDMSYYDSKSCKQYLSELKSRLIENAYDINIKKQITIWQKRLRATELLGSYRTIGKHNRIFIQADIKVKGIKYLEILDQINKGLLELRNEMCQDKFNIEYTKLNLSISKEKIIKEAIDEVYPVLINPIFFYEMNFPPPPPLPR